MSTHIGRSWPGMGNPIEVGCLCPKEPCGLVDPERAHPGCGQHPMRLAKAIRQSHPDDRCPGGSTVDSYRRRGVGLGWARLVWWLWLVAVVVVSVWLVFL